MSTLNENCNAVKAAARKAVCLLLSIFLLQHATCLSAQTKDSIAESLHSHSFLGQPPALGKANPCGIRADFSGGEEPVSVDCPGRPSRLWTGDSIRYFPQVPPAGHQRSRCRHEARRGIHAGDWQRHGDSVGG